MKVKKKYALVCHLYFNMHVLTVFECFKIIRYKGNVYARHFQSDIIFHMRLKNTERKTCKQNICLLLKFIQDEHTPFMNINIKKNVILYTI